MTQFDRRIKRLDQTQSRAVDALLAAVRKNRPKETDLLNYLKDYTGAAWRYGYEAGIRAERARKARA